MAHAQYPVTLRVYDISDGKAAIWSPVVLWKKIDGVWHTGVQAYGYEYFYGGGIVKMLPEDVENQYRMKPKQIIPLGITTIPQSDFEQFLLEIQDEFCRETYDLLKWNCNNFSDVCTKFLLGMGLPDGILSLPDTINKTLIGHLIVKAVKAFRGGPPVAADGNSTLNRTERVHSATRFRRMESQLRLDNEFEGKTCAYMGRRYSAPNQMAAPVSCGGRQYHSQRING